MKKLYIALALILSALSALSAFASAERQAVEEAVLRLHVVAKSDSEEDQAIKLRVRDAVLEEFSKVSGTAKTKEEALLLAEQRKEALLLAARRVLKEEGTDYDASIRIGKSAFPKKRYGDVTLPAGYYEAVIVTLGEGRGHNWWCVMYPPLCAAAAVEDISEEGKRLLEEALPQGAYHLITGTNDTTVQIKLKILELF